MPKIKTCKTAAKRFEFTGTGKVRRGHTGMNHLKMKKPKSGRRRLSIKSGVTTGQNALLRDLFPGRKFVRGAS